MIALKLKEELRDKKEVAGTLINIGSTYEKFGNYPQALKNYFAAMDLELDLGRQATNSYLPEQHFTVYEKRGDYAESLNTTKHP